MAGNLRALRERCFYLAWARMLLPDKCSVMMVMMRNMNAERLQQLAKAPRQDELQGCPDTEDGF